MKRNFLNLIKGIPLKTLGKGHLILKYGKISL